MMAAAIVIRLLIQDLLQRIALLVTREGRYEHMSRIVYTLRKV